MALRPYQIIGELSRERRPHSDQEILTELAALSVLPEEEDQAWASEKTWDHAYLYVALADVAAERKLAAAITLLLERASYGDPGEDQSSRNFLPLPVHCQKSCKSLSFLICL